MVDKEPKGTDLATTFFQIPIALSVSAGATSLVIFTLLKVLDMPSWSESYQNFAWLGAILIISGVSWLVVGQVLSGQNK